MSQQKAERFNLVSASSAHRPKRPHILKRETWRAVAKEKLRRFRVNLSRRFPVAGK
jgi:hypothetical protein